MRIVVLVISVLLYFNLQAQNVDWLNTYGSNYTTDRIHICYFEKETKNSVFVLNIVSDNNRNLNDTIQLDTIQLILPNLGNQSSIIRRNFIVKCDSTGHILMVKELGRFDVLQTEHDLENNIYIVGLANDTVPNHIAGTSVNIDTAKSRLILFKLDTYLNLLWVNQYGLPHRSILFGGMEYNEIVKIENRHVYLTVNCIGSINIGDSSYFFSKFTSVLFEIKPLNGDVLWSKCFFKNAGTVPKYSGLALFKSNIYLSFNNSYTSIIIGNDTIKGNSTFILQLDTIGVYKSLILLETSRIDHEKYITGLESNETHLIISGYFTDSSQFGVKLFGPSFPSGSKKTDLFISALDENLKFKWIYRPKILNLQYSQVGGGYIIRVKSTKDFIYSAAQINAKSDFGPSLISPKGPFTYVLGVFKMDLVGNVLWAADTKSTGQIYSMDVSQGATVLLGGRFSEDSIQFGARVKYNSGSISSDAFITKLSDNAIIRGYVSNGPYCAGDTFKVPYRKIGDYDTSNYFIAELSDADGNFNGGQRELGRIKSNQDSVILGKLPLFQVGSSEKYRIRILSTAPAVQSYYKVDTLRLLVYSRDKANPGPDTTICKGDTVLLQTYGGTKWTWSLKYKMKDSSARETKAWPDKTTTYKIIIADSSGCGEADTATKTVFVRNGLSVQFHTKTDTAVCLGGSLLVKASFHGGDSMAYNWQWTAIDSKGQYSFPRSGSGKQTDSLLFTMPPGETDSVRLVLSLTDGCTPGSAFSIYTLKIKKSKAQTVFLPGDTAACPGKPLPLIATFKNGAAALLSWQWQEKNQFNQWLNRQSGSKKQGDTVSYTMPTNWKGLKQWRLILKDNCSGLNDTAIYNITPRDTLKLSLNTGDTTLCKGQAYTFKASGKDGYPAGYVFVWTDVNTGDTLSWADSLTLQAETSRQIKVSLTDNCMPGAINRTITLQVHPALQAEMNLKQDTVLCHGRNLNLTASASGGKGSGYTFKWVLEQTEIGTQDSLQFKSADYFTAPGTKTLYLILNDACSKPADTTQINITVLAPLKVAVNTIDSICYGNSALFKATVTGGKGNINYKWLNENNALQGNTDSLKLFNQSSSQTTIKRQVIVSDGCSKNDTATVQTVFLAPLNILVSTTDSCPTANTTLTATTSGGKAGQHLVTWYNNNNIQIGSGSSILVNPNGSAQTYRAILKDNCSEREDTAYLLIGSKPAVKLSATGVCLGDETSIIAKKINTSNALNYQWEINNVPAPETDSLLKRKFAAVGTYKIKVSVSAGTACNGNDSTTVEIIHKPKAAFQYVHFQSNGMGIPFKFLNHSQNATTYHWYFGTGDTSQAKSPDYTFRDTGKATVILIASNRNKCFDTATQTLPIYDKIEFYFPNVFSPDGNNINEGFGLHAGQVQFVKEFHLQVYNRWGELVYNSKDASGVWRGEGSQQSVYIWKAEIRDLYNVLHELEGVVELLR